MNTPARIASVVSLHLILAGSTPAVQILGPRIGPEGFELRWSTLVGKRYSVETAPAVTGPWSSRFERTADGPTLSWTDPDRPDDTPLRLYRVVESEPPAEDMILEHLQVADRLPAQIAALYSDHRETCVSAVYLASSLRGGALTTNGTLSQSITQWTYSAVPVGRLVVQFLSGTNLTYRVDLLQGDFSGNVATFLDNGHEFSFAVTQPGILDLVLGSSRPAGRCGIQPKGSVAGSALFSNVTYTVNLHSGGSYCFENDLSGFSLTEDYRITGSVSSAQSQLTVDYRRRYEDVGADGDDASTEQIWLAHRLVLGAGTFVWEGVNRQKSFRNGRPSNWQPPGYWSATGRIIRDSVPVAAYEYVPANQSLDGFLRFLLRAQERTVELERWFPN